MKTKQFRTQYLIEDNPKTGGVVVLWRVISNGYKNYVSENPRKNVCGACPWYFGEQGIEHIKKILTANQYREFRNGRRGIFEQPPVSRKSHNEIQKRRNNSHCRTINLKEL